MTFGSVHPPAAWRSATQDLSTFRRTLPVAGQQALIDLVRSTITEGRELDTLKAEDLPLGDLAAPILELRADLLHERGFAIVSGFPVDSLSPEEIERFFWALGLHLGTPVSQSVMGERLGHVRDVTTTDPHARAYRNNSELTPHSDPADLLAFLCLQPAASGGVSRFVSSAAIHEEIRRTRPDLLERLYRGYRYHRLGEEQPGTSPVTAHRVPVFSTHDDHTSCRYVRHYIEVAAAEFDDIEIDELDREAFELLEDLAADPALHFEFTLQAGEAVFANNFTVLHARSSFHDGPSAPPRHLLRLWLAAEPPRPLTPNILHYDGEPGIQPVAGRTPSYSTDVGIQ